MEVPLILGILFLWAVLWVLLDRHEKRRARNGKPRHSRVRLIAASAALLVMLFACGLAFLIVAHAGTAQSPWKAIGLSCAPPFIGALLIWRLAMRRKAG
ncbi:hypothetical protein [Aestuariivirga sp.]|uniref:hypothetical protein n=1 Tax=Aestuariivirga sp. TaxID=2650926 RepID=UPI0039E41A3C